MERKFRIRIKNVHDGTGLTPYAVSKKIEVSLNTVKKFVDQDEIVTDQLNSAILRMCAFYGVDWHDVVTEIVVGEEESPENKTPAIAV